MWINGPWQVIITISIWKDGLSCTCYPWFLYSKAPLFYLVNHTLVIIGFAISIVKASLLIALDVEVDCNISGEADCIELVIL